MVVLESLGQAFIIAGQAAEAAQPAERAFDDPALRQQHEPALRFRVLDDLSFEGVWLGLGGCGFAGVALVGVGDLDRAAGHWLDLFSQCSDLRPLDASSMPQHDNAPKPTAAQCMRSRLVRAPGVWSIMRSHSI